MLNSVLGSAGASAEGEHAATRRAQASNAILPALRMPLSMIRFLSQVQHCRKARRCPSPIITIAIVCNIHMIVAHTLGPRATARRLGGRASKGNRVRPFTRPHSREFDAAKPGYVLIFCGRLPVGRRAVLS